MVHGQFQKVALGKGPFYFCFEVLPLERAPEVVCHQESAIEQVFAQSRNFSVVQTHGPGLDHVNEGIVEEFRFGEGQDPAVRIDLEGCDLLKTIGKIKVAIGKIGEAVAGFAWTVWIAMIANAHEGENILFE